MVEGIKWIRLMHLYPDVIPVAGLGRLINESESIFLTLTFRSSMYPLRCSGPWGRHGKGTGFAS